MSEQRGCKTYLGQREPVTASEKGRIVVPIEQRLQFFHHDRDQVFRGRVLVGFGLRTLAREDQRHRLGEEGVDEESDPGPVEGVGDRSRWRE